MRPARPAALLAAALTTVLLAAACSGTGGGTGGSGGTGAATPPSPSGSERTAAAAGRLAQASAGTPRVLASGLKVPWGVAFLPGGDALVSERDTHLVKRVTPGGEVRTVGTVQGVADDAGEGGLLGLALSPTFARDRLVYAYCTTTSDNRIVRFRYDGTALSDQRPVRTGLVYGPNHDGGRIAFGPDGLLYATAGEGGQPDRAQDRSVLGGKVLRMTPAGAPAPGNPFPGSVVYTYGHRNPQGLAWGPGRRLYQAEFGQDALDEINRLRPGRNYGWPVVEGTNGPASGRYTRPLLTWRTEDASPSGLAYAGGSLWLATLQGARVYRIPVHRDGGLGAPQSLWDGRWGRLRTVAVAPDGSLWITTSNEDGRGAPSGRGDLIVRVPLT